MLAKCRHVLPMAMLWLLIAPAWADKPVALEVYGDLPGIEQMSISPNGEGLAVIGRLNGERRFTVFDAQHKIRATGLLGDTKPRSLRWNGDDTVLVITSATQNLGMGFTADKTELYNAILIRLDGSSPVQVFGNRSDILKAVFGDYGTRLIDGKWVSFFGGVELALTGDRIHYRLAHGRPALFSIDAARNSPTKIATAPPEGHWRRWLLDEHGAVGATLDLDHTNGRWRITNQNGAVIASGLDPTGDVGLIGFGADGSSVIYRIEDDANGVRHRYEVPLVGGEPQHFLPDVDVERFYVDPVTGRMMGYLASGGDPKPVLFDAKRQMILGRVYRAFPKLDAQIVEWTPDFGHFLVHTSGNGDSGTWFVVDVAARKADPAGYDYPAIEEAAVGAISTIPYKAADGLDLDGILTLPPGSAGRNLPMVMLPHGGPNTQSDPVFNWWAQAFASRGYAVFEPNFRGSTNRDETFRRAGNGERGGKMQSDISDGLAGGSYGGYAALAGVTLQQGLYRCAVAIAPVSDLGDMYVTENRESGGNQTVRRSLRESLGKPSGFAAVSPRRNAARADAPILLIHGKDDTVVPFRQSTAMADALKDAGKPYEFVVLKEEDHWLSRATTRKQMLEAAVAFVSKHNPAN